MKIRLPILLIAATLLSCKKQNQPQPVTKTTQTVRFVLYTDQDFSKDEDTISFKLVIRNNAGTINSHTILDTMLATRKFKDIPGPANKLIIEKVVPNNGSELSVGFIYTDRFGAGSHFDTVAVNEKLKVFQYNFQ